MGWFFTKAALLTFGGAYAVLPYVYQGGIALFRFKLGTIKLIFTCALAGLVLSYS
jgi:hypothetical protein